MSGAGTSSTSGGLHHKRQQCWMNCANTIGGRSSQPCGYGSAEAGSIIQKALLSRLSGDIAASEFRSVYHPSPGHHTSQPILPPIKSDQVVANRQFEAVPGGIEGFELAQPW